MNSSAFEFDGSHCPNFFSAPGASINLNSPLQACAERWTLFLKTSCQSEEEEITCKQCDNSRNEEIRFFNRKRKISCVELLNYTYYNIYILYIILQTCNFELE